MTEKKLDELNNLFTELKELKQILGVIDPFALDFEINRVSVNVSSKSLRCNIDWGCIGKNANQSPSLRKLNNIICDEFEIARERIATGIKNRIKEVECIFEKA
jgi:hypothetical protein